MLEGGKRKATDTGVITYDKISQLEYTTYVIKETLRLDPPGVRSLGYKTKQRVQFAGVTVPKGQDMRVNVIGAHFNLLQWK